MPTEEILRSSSSSSQTPTVTYTNDGKTIASGGKLIMLTELTQDIKNSESGEGQEIKVIVPKPKSGSLNSSVESTEESSDLTVVNPYEYPTFYDSDSSTTSVPGHGREECWMCRVSSGAGLVLSSAFTAACIPKQNLRGKIFFAACSGFLLTLGVVRLFDTSLASGKKPSRVYTYTL